MRTLVVVWLCGAVLLQVFTCAAGEVAQPDPAPYQSAEPQPRGWPLSDAERAFVLRPEHQRRPGSEQNKHLPALWPVVPSAGHWGGTSWLDTHGKLVQHVASRPGPVDFLLVGDSITQQWGSPLDGRAMNAGWTAQFGDASVVNLGIGGDKTQNLLWRLEHGGVEGLEPRCIVLMIGNNNMFFAPETGVQPVAKGVQACLDTLRRQFPRVPVVVVKILPAHAPGN
ncbi:MAG: GDSL-type esterase/lipase family protein, partial [Planctomycetaceae bacterium]